MDSVEDRINNLVSLIFLIVGSGYVICFYNVLECNISVWGCVCMCVWEKDRENMSIYEVKNYFYIEIFFR